MLLVAKDLEPGEHQGPLGFPPNSLRPPDRTAADRRESPSEGVQRPALFCATCEKSQLARAAAPML